MAIETVPMYRVVCDGCGTSAQDGDYYAWAQQEGAIEEADDSGWLLTDDGQWCLDCTSYDEVEDEYVSTKEYERRAAERYAAGPASRTIAIDPTPAGPDEMVIVTGWSGDSFTVEVNPAFKMEYRINPLTGYIDYVPHEGWPLCEGQALSKREFGVLYNVLTRGGEIECPWGEDEDTFNLPDLRVRVSLPNDNPGNQALTPSTGV